MWYIGDYNMCIITTVILYPGWNGVVELKKLCWRYFLRVHSCSGLCGDGCCVAIGPALSSCCSWPYRFCFKALSKLSSLSCGPVDVFVLCCWKSFREREEWWRVWNSGVWPLLWTLLWQLSLSHVDAQSSRIYILLKFSMGSWPENTSSSLGLNMSHCVFPLCRVCRDLVISDPHPAPEHPQSRNKQDTHL